MKLIESYNNIKLIEYSDKSIVITGKSMDLYFDFLEIGGRYNRYLKSGPGWIFPKSKLELVKNILSIYINKNEL